MPDIDITCFIADLGGVATVGDLADFLEVSEREVRAWARENGVPRAGNSFAFPLKQAQMLADDLAANEEEEEEEEEEEDEEEGADDDTCDADDE